VLDEAMRLYPPALRIERRAQADDVLGDLAVRKGDLVAVWPWIVHRHEALWTRPEAFDPERFSPEARAGRHRFQYLPFGAGPRVCIGAQFATSEALVILANWLALHEVSPAPGYELALASDITMKPRGALPLHVKLRRTSRHCCAAAS
jgi:cytochrome P450